MTFRQSEFDLRCEWGLEGLHAILPGCEAVIIVDVLSFCTAVDVAVARGGIVIPAALESAGIEIASREGASLARPRAAGGPSGAGDSAGYATGYSLSPLSMQRISPGERVVLLSPNGARLSLETGDLPTLAGCLRNAEAVATVAMRIGKRIGVVAAGERWPDGSLRPAIEDWLGAGAVLFHLRGTGSPEARVAMAAFHDAMDMLPAAIRASASARELIDRGCAADVEIAGAYNASTAAPILLGGAFVNAADRQGDSRFPSRKEEGDA